MKKQPVIFRVHQGTGQVFALLPAIVVGGGNGFCRSLHRRMIPQVVHGVDFYSGSIAASRPATTNEAQDLLKDIQNMGLSVVVRKKWNKRKVKE